MRASMPENRDAEIRHVLTVTQQVCGSADAARECRRLITVLLSKEARVAGTQCVRARGEEEAGEASGGAGPDQVELRRSRGQR